MSNAARVLEVASGDVGTAEATGSNDGPRIREWQELAEAHYPAYPKGSLVGAPWCAIWVHSVFHRAGVELDHGLSHPWTGTICDTARAQKLWLAKGALAPPASIIVSCGIHTGIVVRDRGNGLLDTIEGNSGNAVRRVVRDKSEWQILVPPAITGQDVPAVVMRDSWGFDDLHVKPDTWGGWARQQARDDKLRAFARNHPELWTAAVRLDRDNAPYAFRSGKRGTYGVTWKFGGWSARRIREERIAAYCRARGIKNEAGIRRWKTRVPDIAPQAGEATAAGAISTT